MTTVMAGVLSASADSSAVFKGEFWKNEGAFYGDGRVPSEGHLKTPDNAPHGHLLSYKIDIPSTGWYAPFFSGGAPLQDYYVDGVLVFMNVPCGPKEKDGTMQGPALWLEKGSHELRLERPGRRGFPMQKFSSFELRPIDGIECLQAKIAGHDVVRLGEKITVELTGGCASGETEYEIQYALQGDNSAEAWKSSAKVSFPTSATPVTKRAEVILPAEGMYYLRATVGGKAIPQNAFPKFQVLAIDVNEHGSESSEMKLEPVVEIDCVAQAPDAESNGKSRVTKKNNLEYRESHDCSKTTNEPYDGNFSENLSGFAYKVKVPQAQVPYLLEVEFPDDARRSVCVYHGWCEEGTNLYLKANYGYQTKSWETGGFFPISNTMKKQGQIIWPLSTEGQICIINQSAGTRAACAKIRISRFADDMPPAQGMSVKNGRSFAYWSEEGDSFGIMLGAGAGANFSGKSISYLEAGKRWCQMIRFYGGNAVSGVGFAYQGANWKTKALVGVGLPDYSKLRMFALLAEKYRMSFIPEYFNTQWFMDRVIYPQRAGGSENSMSKSSTGSLIGGGVNALCPEVQIVVVDAMKEIYDEIGDSPAFKGLSVRADGWQYRGEFFFKSLNWGYNESNVRAFERETGIKVPAGDATSYFHFLTSPEVKEKWIRWRCDRIADYHGRILAALRGDGKRNDVFFGIAGQFDQEDLYLREKTLVERALGSGVDAVACREKDGISIIPISRYGSRTPSAGSRAIYDQFFMTESTEGGMCSPRAFAGYMTYMELGTGWPATKLGFDLSLRGGKAPYECSGVIAAGRAGLEKYAVVLAEQDTSYFREGGNSDCLGSPDIFGPWFSTWEKIPAEKFERAPGLNDPVAVWHKNINGTYWYYAVNKEHFDSSVTLKFSDGTEESFVLEPFGLKVFSENKGRIISNAVSEYPEAERMKVRSLLAYAQSINSEVGKPEFTAGLTRAWTAAEAGKWWRARVELNMAPMYRGYQYTGNLPTEVLRTTFPDKLDTQNPKNGHWQLCTQSKPVQLLDYDKSTASIWNSKDVNSAWVGDKVLWSKDGEITFSFDVSAEGRYDLVLGAVSEKKGVASVSANGKILNGICRFEKAREPMNTTFRGINLMPGKVTFTVKGANSLGIYGVRFLPVVRPIPGTDWAVADKFGKYWGTFSKFANGDEALKAGFDDLMKTDLSKLKWNYASPGIRDALWYRGVHMPLRVSSVGADRIIAKTTVISDRDRTATFISAVDWWARVTVNGELIKTDVVGGGSEINGCSFWSWYPMYTGLINLKKGENELVVYLNGGSLGSAITGWITDDEGIITTAKSAMKPYVISNGTMAATINPEYGGRVMSFGKKDGKNWLWNNCAVPLDDPKAWKNYGGEKTWVGTIGGGWGEMFGGTAGWPPPKWFDDAPLSVEYADAGRIDLHSVVSPGDIWNVVLNRKMFFEGDSLVIRSVLETRGRKELPPERMRNWSVTQVPEGKKLLVHLMGRKRVMNDYKTEGAKPEKEFGDFRLYDLATYGNPGLLTYDADMLAVQYNDGWIVARQRAASEAFEPFDKPRAAVFHSGPVKDDPDGKKQYIELEYFSFGSDTSMDIILTVMPQMTAEELSERIMSL